MGLPPLLLPLWPPLLLPLWLTLLPLPSLLRLWLLLLPLLLFPLCTPLPPLLPLLLLPPTLPPLLLPWLLPLLLLLPPPLLLASPPCVNAANIPVPCNGVFGYGKREAEPFYAGVYGGYGYNPVHAVAATPFGAVHSSLV